MTDLFTLSDIARPPLRYHGGKFRLAPWIIPQLPPHRVYVDVFGGGAGLLIRKSRSVIRAGKSYAREWAGVPDALAAAAERFIGVTIENLDYRKLIPKFDHQDVFFYADPPYLPTTRDAGGKGYVHEMTEHDHRQLAWILNNVKGKVAISGYPSSLYDELYKGWRCTEKEHAANGQRGSVPRIEKLWMNYDAAPIE